MLRKKNPSADTVKAVKADGQRWANDQPATPDDYQVAALRKQALTGAPQDLRAMHRQESGEGRALERERRQQSEPQPQRGPEEY
ncbi:hypothetical protein ABT354_11035 [Streptomyces sp. NPDC000594]|uniref:hypothetical protein n=1 Tax=Streptomyces sp. NPDC000594 TaxID=3154261 RepID=UPI0033229C0F